MKPLMSESRGFIRRMCEPGGVFKPCGSSSLFMRANGDQLSEITSLIDQGVIRPVVERVFPFESTQDALDFVEKGRAKGKVVVNVT